MRYTIFFFVIVPLLILFYLFVVRAVIEWFKGRW